MKLIYYPGCTLKNSARNFDTSTVTSMAKLDVEIEELERWNCCGTVHALGSDNVMNRVAPVTNLIRVKEAKATEFMTSCAMCYNTLKRANNDVKAHANKLNTINEFLNLEETKYEGDVFARPRRLRQAGSEGKETAQGFARGLLLRLSAGAP